MVATIPIDKAFEVLNERQLPGPVFTMGLLSLMLKAYLLGWFPPLVCVYSSCQWPILFYIVFKGFKERKSLFYFFELCWVINFVGWSCMFIELLTVTGFVPPFLSNSTRNRLGYGFFVVTNGPLAASIIMNSNTLVLHDIVKTSGVFIHWNPALVSFALRWRLMWTQGGSWAPFNHHGGFFASESDAQHEPKHFGDAILLYLAWFIPYSIWLLTKGVYITGHRSSFLDMRGKIISLFKLPPSDLRKQGVAYLFVHFVANTSIFVLASFLYDYFVLHAAWIVLLLVVATYLGGQYYEFTYGGKRAIKRLRQEFVRGGKED
ncbi:hypothetical protein TrRE_jg6950 [Triparma retinervis]|uniref:Glycerophosphocholine acyltransferase 1 n=1 Tax=Triparma retinervis TaxID=2557542 RepID=A0A9W7E355_9STRA|nr:hypothetical protein TrRE_jg6950 [Triparma retinervis]